MTADAANLAAFVAATSGRRGTVCQVRGAIAVAGPVPVANGFVDTAVPTDVDVPPGRLLDDLGRFYGDLGRGYVLWVPGGSAALAAEAVARGGVPDRREEPVMVIDHRIGTALGAPSVTVRVVEGEAERAVLGDVCERGYGLEGLAWLLDVHDAARAPGTTWVVAWDGGTPVGVACGFVDPGGDGGRGGIYYVATPPEHRGRGVAAALTAWLTDAMFDAGVGSVGLQSSELGFGVYRRLGFEVVGHYWRHAFDPPYL